MVTRPILRYHGGKWMLAPWIISHFPDHRIYTEAFGGAASVLLQKKRSYCEVYNDLDDEVVNLFRVVRESGPELIRFLELTPYSSTEYKQSYEIADCDPFELARKTLIRSFMGFASGIQSTQKTGFRANSNRAGTTPAHDWNNFPRSLEAIIERMKGVVIENREAIEVIKQHDTPKTLHYLDPPYKLETRYAGESTNIYKFEMNTDQHVKLLKSLALLEGMVVLSGYDNTLYNDMLTGWQKATKTSVASGGKGSIKRIETLWISPNCKYQHKLF